MESGYPSDQSENFFNLPEDNPVTISFYRRKDDGFSISATATLAGLLAAYEQLVNRCIV